MRGNYLYVLAALLSLVNLRVGAHESWLQIEHKPAAKHPEQFFKLVTGSRYPNADSTAPHRYVEQLICVSHSSSHRLLPIRLQTEDAFRFKRHVAGPLICGLRTQRLDITLNADKLHTYFEDIHPTPEIVARRAEQERNGMPWLESYRKSAWFKRDAAQPYAMTDLRQTFDNGAVRLTISAPYSTWRAGQTQRVLLEVAGEPLAGQAVELVGESLPVGVWLSADDHGALSFTPPLPGWYLLRAVYLRWDEDQQKWMSDFINLRFEVHPA